MLTTSWLRRIAAATAFVVLIGLAAAFPSPANALPAGGMTASALAAMFQSYGDTGTTPHWVGGDSTVSVELPDGRVAWLFSDTFVGAVNADGTLPRETPLVNNTLVVQEGTALTGTLHGGQASEPEALAVPQLEDHFFWVGGAFVESGALKVLYNRYHRYGSSALEVELTGTSLVTFALPDLTISSVVDLPLGRQVAWGSAIVSDGTYTYIYGASSGLGGMTFGHVARVPSGDLGAPWQFWTGSEWGDTDNVAGRVLSGVGTGFAVQRIGTQYVLVTQDTNFIFNPQFVAYTAESPTGPFTGSVQLFTASEQQPGGDKIVYHARLHQELARSGKLLVSYDVNSLNNDDVYNDAGLYRPRFVEVDWPRPEPDPATLPAMPLGLQATPDSTGAVTLSWPPVSGASEYRIYRRDVTGGQTHLSRQWQGVSGTSVTLGDLITTHRYEFSLTAVNAVGEGPLAAAVSAVAHAERDASVIDLANTPEAVPGSYLVRFKENLSSVRNAGSGAMAQELLDQLGGGTIDSVYTTVLVGFSAELTEAQAIDLAGHPDVLDVEQDQWAYLAGEQPLPPSWGLDRVDQRTKVDPSLPPVMYRYPNTAKDVTVYVVDTGIDVDHPEFEGRASYGIDTYHPTSGSAEDCHGHGTHVAGTVGSKTFGVAKKAKLVSVKVLDCYLDANGNVQVRGTIHKIAAGVEWVAREKPAHAVINISLGIDVSTNTTKTRLDDAVKEAVEDNGITVVAAAGNEKRRSDGTLIRPAVDACTVVPAKIPSAITVGNMDITDTRHASSNFGDCVDIFAPGTDITSTNWQDVATPIKMTGTSMAAPHVAGVAAMILQAHPDYSPSDVWKAMDEASTKDVVQNAQGPNDDLVFVERPPLTAPANLTATAQGDGTIELNWTAVPEERVHYRIKQRDVTFAEAEPTKLDDKVQATTYVAGNLVEGHTYEFTVVAANSVGTSPDSNVASATARTDQPAAPANLTATANNDGTITLDWVSPDPSQELWFTVYQRQVGDADFVALPIPIFTCCTMTAGLLLNDEEYEYQVTASNAGGEGPPSNIAQARSQYPPPAPPTDLTATPGDGEVTLTWDPSPTPDVWYWVYQRKVGDADFIQLPLPLTTCCTFTPGLLSNNEEYEFKVTAINQGGESAAAGPVQVTPRKPLPGKVTGLSATPNPDGTITLDWTEPANGPHWYIMYWRDVDDEDFTEGEIPVTTCCTWTAGLLQHNHRYEFKVVATNGREGPPSEPVQATAWYDPPAAPENLRGIAAGDGYIDLDWDPPGPGGFLYWIDYRDVTQEESFTRVGYPTDKTSASLGPLRHGDVYEFKVSAANQGGEGPSTPPIQITSVGGLPAPPSNLSASAGDGKVTLTWTASPSPDVWYWVEYRPANGSWTRMEFPLTTCCSHTVQYLANGTTYEFRLRATNFSGDSTASNVASARPMPPLPQPPSGLTAAAGDGNVTLHWTASPSPSVWYWVEYRPANGSWRRLEFPLTTCCSHTVHYLMNGTTYEFRLRATNLAGDSAPSNVASARPMPPLPQPPSGLTATAGDGKVTLHWTASPTPNVWYWIEYRRSGGAWQRLQFPVTTCCTNTVRYLVNGGWYDFRVRATNLSGDSAPSNVASARPMPPRPTAPTGLTWYKINTYGARLVWGPSTPSNVYYWVYRRDLSKGEPFRRLPLPVSTTSVKQEPLQLGHRYEFYVTAANIAGEGPASNHVTINLGPKDLVRGCASVASSYRNTDNEGGIAQYYYPRQTMCARRNGDRLEVDMSWTSYGHHLYDGIFWFTVFDCKTGGLVYSHNLSYPDNPTQTSGSAWTSFWINSADTYRVRVAGWGHVNAGGLTARFSPWFDPSAPSAIPFISYSRCF